MSVIRRLFCLCLALCMVLPYVPLRSRSAEIPGDSSAPAELPTQADSFFDHITLRIDGEAATSAQLSTAGHLTLTADFDAGDDAIDALTWQIYDPVDCQWLPISGADSTRLQVGAAMLQGMTDEDATALLNCKITSGGALYYSPSVQLRLVSPEASASPAAAAPMALPQAAAPLDDPPIQGGELVTYTVTVEYCDLNGNPLAQAYTATVQGNGSLQVNPKSPTVVGYTPYIIHQDGDPTKPSLQPGDEFQEKTAKEVYVKDSTRYYGVKVENLEIDLQNVTSNHTYRVVYLPNEVTYTVSHYMQNVTSDDYVLFFVETKKGYVGEMTEATDMTAPGLLPGYPETVQSGFTALVPFQDAEIAADGTTQIETYYDRLYYLITFKLGDGRGVRPIYARYGTPVSVGTPERSGYDFAGWYWLQMQTDTSGNVLPRPKKDEKGNYLPIDHTDENADWHEAAVLEPGEDGYYNQDGKKIEPLKDLTKYFQNGMPATHGSLLAVWTESDDTSYNVIYWLEKADYVKEDVTSIKDQYDYWCSKTLYAKTGTDLSTELQTLEDPTDSGTGAANEEITVYQQLYSFDNLDGKSLVLYSTQATMCVGNELNENQALNRENFIPSQNESATEWLFTRQGDGTYLLSSGGNYIQAIGDEILGLTSDKNNATPFTVIPNDSNTVYLKYTHGSYTGYLNNYGGNGNANKGFKGWKNITDGSNFTLHEMTTQTVAADIPYYVYSRSDLRPEGVNTTTTTSITVSADGQTTVNVYYNRRVYNLRFFYARSYEKEDGTTQFQVVGGSTYGYSDEPEEHETEPLLQNIDEYTADKEWGDVSQPIIARNSKLYEVDNSVEVTIGDTKYTYYALIFHARYGENIAEVWPSDVFDPVDCQFENNKKPTWPGKKAVFSAWNGEYWLKYSCDQRKLGKDKANYTIKGNYQQLDENLLYDPSFDDEYRKTLGPYYERGTGNRYLDFIAFWENGADISWSVPKQFYYCLWVKHDDQDAGQYFQNKEYKGGLPHSKDDYEKLSINDRMIFDGVCYRLYDIVDSCDNKHDAAEQQTIPGISGYVYAGDKFTGTYPTFAERKGKLYYINDGWDQQTYESSYSLHYLYKPREYSITLHSHGKTETISNVPYGSMDGADKIKAEFGYEQMMSKYYPDDLPEGAYKFAGWYKSPEHLDGTDADLTRGMPSNNMILYAKWVPKRFDLQVYQTSDLDKLVHFKDSNGELVTVNLIAEEEYNDKLGASLSKPDTGVGYGDPLPSVIPPAGPDLDINGNNANTGGDIQPEWIFVCWAYMEDGVEYAIDADSFRVEGDVKLYAKWTATEIVHYQINYALANLEQRADNTFKDLKTGDIVEFRDDGNLYFVGTDTPWTPAAQQKDGKDIFIAESLTGRQNEGANRTFIAKTGDALNEGYRSGYFPLHTSHTVLMQPGPDGEGTSEDKPLVQTFYYVYMTNVPYTVHYLDLNGKSVYDSVERPNEGESIKMVVTENYLYKDGFTPDALQKTLILSANPALNQITFHYSTEEGRPYRVAHYAQTLDPSKSVLTVDNKYYTLHYEEDGYITDGKSLTVNYLSIPGSEYIRDEVTVYSSLSADYQPVKGKTEENQRHKMDVPLGQTVELKDALDKKCTLTLDDGGYTIQCKAHGTHTMEDNIFYYNHEGEDYEVRAIQPENGNITLTLYNPKPAPIQVDDPGQYGTEVAVFYDLKEYPYFIYHRIHGSDVILETTVGKEQFQTTVSASAWTESELIDKNYPGYTMDTEDKTITMTMTMTIRDDDEDQFINTMTFYYFEKSIAFSYKTMVSTPTGIKPLDDPNAQVSTEAQNVPAATGTAYASVPNYNTAAYEFVGWYLDEACTQSVAESDYYKYLGTGVNGNNLTGQLLGQTNEDPAKYEVLQPQKLEGMYYYKERTSADTYALCSKNLAEIGKSIYVGALAYDSEKQPEVHTSSQTFYALFVPKQGKITITRDKIGEGTHNEANSFVYRIQGTNEGNGIDMYVTLDPGEANSVTVVHLPFGDYTVTQCNDWSWRYGDKSQTVKLDAEHPYGTATFGDEMSKNYWLSGFAKALVNIFTQNN